MPHDVTVDSTMRRPFLIGDQIYLRPFEAADIRGPYIEWLNDGEVTRFLETGVFPTSFEALEQYANRVTQSPDNVMLAIVERATNNHVGNIKLGPIHWLHRRADLGVLVGDKRCWGRGYGREAVRLMMVYGFTRLNLNKITLGVDADHDDAVTMYEQLGFKREGTLRQQVFRDGAFRDKLVMGILRSDFPGGPPAAGQPSPTT